MGNPIVNHYITTKVPGVASLNSLHVTVLSALTNIHIYSDILQPKTLIVDRV